MRIGYFGGSFDPPHRGHLAVARAARDRFALDRVLLAPTARQPFKPSGPVASFADRLRMTELLCAGEPNLEASDLDGPQPGDTPNYTVDTLRRLQDQLALGCHARRESAIPNLEGIPESHLRSDPPPQLFAIVGADAFLAFPQWRSVEELLRLAEWIVVSRPGHTLPSPTTLSLSPAQQTRIHSLDSVANPISATALRAALAAGQPCTEAFPEPVHTYIQSHQLYTCPKT